MNNILKQLLQDFTDDDAKIRHQAAINLSNLKDETALPELFNLLEHSNPDIRRLAAYAIGEIETKINSPETISESEINQLISSLKSNNILVRSIAASALGEIDAKIAIPALRSCLIIETDPNVHYYMTQALKKLCDRLPTTFYSVNNG
jgi:HEAT repeat protein